MLSTESQLDVPARIADHIRELISKGNISPGEHLGQAELADRFEASRVPVREALKLLAAEGSLMHDPNRGFFVARLSSDEAKQLYRLRHLLEAELLSTAEWPTSEQLTDFEKQLDVLTELELGNKRGEWNSRHREFHRAIFDLSPQKIIVREVQRLWTLTDRYRSLLLAAPGRHDGTVHHGTSDERRLIDALADRDRARLLAVFEEERSHVEDLLLGILAARGL